MNDQETAGGRSAENAFACPLTAVLLARVRRVAGDQGVERLLSESGSAHSIEFLEDIGNWIGFDEAIALWNAGEAITCDPGFARHVGEDAVRIIGRSATASVLRSLGSAEDSIRQLNVSSQRFSTAAELEAIAVRPGFAEVRAVAAPGFVRHRQHCEWTIGMLSLTTVLFGLEPARVEHCVCQALGAPDCRYQVTWDPATGSSGEDQQATMLRHQLESLSERLEGVFATAADLISTGDLEETLSRIANRAAQQVRAPKYVLALHPTPGSDLICHTKGLDENEAQAVARRSFEPDAPPEHWCVASVRSHRRDYGRLIAIYHEGAQFFPQERELLQFYAHYAATALDNATALVEARTNRDDAQRRHEEARALLELARRLASAGSTEQIVQRLANAIPAVVDCDRVTVNLWDEERGELVRRAVHATADGDAEIGTKSFRPDEIPQLAAWLERPDPEPYFVDLTNSAIRNALVEVGAVASVTVPIATTQRFLGAVQVSVLSRPERLAASPELRDRLSGVVAQAVIALENGRLVDHITHQAHHDQLTGLANRLSFNEHIGRVSRHGELAPSSFAVFYIDLDRFKPVNDEFGHEVGDSLLRAVSGRLRRCARPNDTVARLGGDEFAVIVEGVEDSVQLQPIAERFERAFDSQFVIDGHKLSVGASIGRAIWPIDATDIDGLLRAADATMYRVKRLRYQGQPSSRAAAPVNDAIAGQSPSDGANAN